ncbi:hypothetical protein HPP92_003449 [Vanilla planifolia]|uniref:Phytocyanin domain-containing protein n=1 Tax=Vanilla planifolia TaxID=51239 RepID=A0A835VIX0_VANPL|nr:hypothetical protein HPP92_003449 [Vanilla planifolia]
MTAASPIIFFLALLSFMASLPVHSFQYDVGGDRGWAVPPSNDSAFYNQWASRNRFQVGDTLRFNYEKDSVMAVDEQEYDKCASPHPIFFSNNGSTQFDLDQPGLFYFISGVPGHCGRGQKMIVKVLGGSPVPVVSPPPDEKGGDESPPETGSAKTRSAFVLPALVPVLIGFIVPLIGLA